MITAAVVLQLLILAGALYDTAALLAPADGRRPWWRRRRLRRTALETAEQRLVEQRLRGRIDAAAYREGMRSVADRRLSRTGRRDAP
ncbi:hypothetical protein ABZ848_30020 [Streptomyces sp. NPDC047081]|uniref:hypothetical protein n=1 Tax=Streptomyces sp. NPDC047081 TaxID=3154706 RepID=UPI0034020207